MPPPPLEKVQFHPWPYMPSSTFLPMEKFKGMERGSSKKTLNIMGETLCWAERNPVLEIWEGKEQEYYTVASPIILRLF